MIETLTPGEIVEDPTFLFPQLVSHMMSKNPTRQYIYTGQGSRTFLCKLYQGRLTVLHNVTKGVILITDTLEVVYNSTISLTNMDAVWDEAFDHIVKLSRMMSEPGDLVYVPIEFVTSEGYNPFGRVVSINDQDWTYQIGLVPSGDKIKPNGPMDLVWFNPDQVFPQSPIFYSQSGSDKLM